MVEDWGVTYPRGIIKYNNLFRCKYFNIDKHLKILNSLYEKYNVKKVIDIGCGTGTYLLKLAEKGYICSGIDTSRESLNIAKSVSEKRRLDIEYKEGDMRYLEMNGVFDAAIAMHLPVSFSSLIETIKAMHKILRNEGSLSFMYLKKQDNLPEEDTKILLSIVEEKNLTAARIESWKLKGDFIEWEHVTLGQNNGNCELFIDQDKMELLSENKKDMLHKEIEDIGYKVLETRPLYGSKSAPPWSIEILETIKK